MRQRNKKLFSQSQVSQVRRRENQLMKAEKEINMLWTEFNIALWYAYPLYFMKQPIYVCSYQPVYRFLNTGNRTGGRKLKLTHSFSRIIGLSILSQGESSENRQKQVELSPTICESLVHSSHITGMFRVFYIPARGRGRSDDEAGECSISRSFLFAWCY